MKKKDNDLGCLFSILVVVSILFAPIVIYNAYVMQKMALWFFSYEQNILFYIGVSTFGNMLALKVKSTKSVGQKENESNQDYFIRGLSEVLTSGLLMPTFYLVFSYIVTNLF